jgi:hypothetical protein
MNLPSSIERRRLHEYNQKDTLEGTIHHPGYSDPDQDTLGVPLKEKVI